MDKLNFLLTTAYKPIFELARRHRLPIADMSATFDPADPSLYVSQIEPSARGGLLISNLLSHVLSRHDFSGPSKTYSIPPDCHGATKALDEAAPFDHDGVVVRDT
jgi:hypothetical protein